MKKNKPLSERFIALQILEQVLLQQTPLNHAFQTQTEITPFIKELCFGVCRHYIRLEELTLLLVKKQPKDFSVWLSLILGLYQLNYLDIPEYAVVKETVGLLDRVKKTSAKGLVNAVLRTFCRNKSQLTQQLAQNEAYIYGHPKWLLQHIQKQWPEHWSAILNENDARSPMTLRVNIAKSSPKDYLHQLSLLNLEAYLHPYAPQAIILNTPCNVHDLPKFAEGYVSVQDAAPQLVVPLLDLKPGLRMLDACCAPGGKTCHILETEPNLAECIAVDVEAERLKRVRENLSRLKLTANLTQGDATNPDIWWDGTRFDRILLDTPCSATGVIRRHPDIKLLRQPQDITSILLLQETLLKSLWPLLKPGGILVYATCSIMPEENEHQIARFIAQTPDCMYTMPPQPWGHFTGHGWQIFPGEANMDGFFYSVLTKKE